MIAALRNEDAGDILAICGGVTPRQDFEPQFEHGTAGIFGSGTSIPDAARNVPELIENRRLTEHG